MVAGLVAAIASYIVGGAKKLLGKATEGIVKQVGDSFKPRAGPALPEAVAKSVGANNYKPRPAYASPPAYAHAVLFAPFILSLGGIASILISKGANNLGELMSPGTNLFLFWLIAFAIMYAVLIMLFYVGKHEAKIISITKMQKPRTRKH